MGFLNGFSKVGFVENYALCVRKSKIEFKNQDMEIFAKSASSTVPEFERVVREKIERDTNSYQNFRNRSKQGIAISYECI